MVSESETIDRRLNKEFFGNENSSVSKAWLSNTPARRVAGCYGVNRRIKPVLLTLIVTESNLRIYQTRPAVVLQIKYLRLRARDETAETNKAAESRQNLSRI